MAVKITIAGLQGGTGKTTSALKIAIELASRHKKVLLIDCDKTQNRLTELLSGSGIHANGVQKIFEGTPIKDVIIKIIDSERYSRLGCRVHYISCDNFDTSPYDKLASRHMFFANVIDDIKHQYDYIIFDTAPYADTLLLNALIASNYVLVPLKPFMMSLPKTFNVIEDCQKVNKKLKLLGGMVVRPMNNFANNAARLAFGHSEVEASNINTTVKMIKTELHAYGLDNAIEIMSPIVCDTADGCDAFVNELIEKTN